MWEASVLGPQGMQQAVHPQTRRRGGIAARSGVSTARTTCQSTCQSETTGEVKLHTHSWTQHLTKPGAHAYTPTQTLNGHALVNAVLIQLVRLHVQDVLAHSFADQR